MRAATAWVMVAILVLVGFSVGCNKPKQEEPQIQLPPEKPVAEQFPEDQVPAPEPQPVSPPVVHTPAPPVDTSAPPVVAAPGPSEPSASAKRVTPVRKPAPQPREQYTSAKKSGRTHTVKKSETLQSISQKYYGTTTKWRRIYDANKKVLSKGPDQIVPGMKLLIP